MKEIVIYGAGSFAKMMRLYLDRVAGQRVVAFCVDDEFMRGISSFDGLPLVAFENIEDLYPKNRYLMFVAVGYTSMRARHSMFERASLKGYHFLNYIDNGAMLDETVILGRNNVVFGGSVLEPFSRLGDNNIVWSSVTISHDVKIGNHCFFASQSLIGGNCTIENRSFIGFNSTCIQNILIAEESLIGAKSLVLSNTDAFSKNVGVPSVKVSSHSDKGILIS
ncbi:acetyltransferase [Marinobacter sp.]|uniref:acetyltransferase n=1 Tax=Marinobacter sp. TaxID=50741 RepID=UPI003A8FE2CC